MTEQDVFFYIEEFRNYYLKIASKIVGYQNAEDVVSAANIRAMQLLSEGKFKHTGHQAKPKAWLAAIVRNVAHEMNREEYKHHGISLYSATELATYDPSASLPETVDLKASWDRADLTADERMIIDLTFIEGYQQKDAAALLSVTERTVRRWLKSAQQKLETAHKESTNGGNDA
jgi:RNA polymerase sigma factor (sigma-70 family)